MNKLLALVAAAVLSLVASSARAESWTNHCDAVWDVSGTELSITNAAQLAKFAHLVNTATNFAGVTISIDAASIDLSKHKWKSAGHDGRQFRGTLLGNGVVISGMRIEEANDVGFYAYAGLIGCVGKNGVVNGITLEGAVINVTYDGGPLFAGGIAGYNLGRIANCANNNSGAVRGVATDPIGNGLAHIGGIAGRSEGVNATLANCENSGDVSATATFAAYAGGIAGYNESGAMLANCENSGSVIGTATVAIYIGGIAGRNINATLANCMSRGSVSYTGTDAKYIGGIAGENFGSNAKIANSYWRIGEDANVGVVELNDGSAIATNCASFTAPPGTLAAPVPVVSFAPATDNLFHALNIWAAHRPADFLTAESIAAFKNLPTNNVSHASLLAWGIGDHGYPELGLPACPSPFWEDHRDTHWGVAPHAPLTLSAPNNTLSITNAAQLAQFAYLINTATNFAHVTVTIDAPALDLSGRIWRTAGDSAHQFLGVLDGKGARLAGMAIIGPRGVNESPPDLYAGLLGYLGPGGVARRLTLTDALIVAEQ